MNFWQSNRRTIMDDPFIRNYIEDLLKNIRTQVLLKLIKPYTRIRIPFISQVIFYSAACPWYSLWIERASELHLLLISFYFAYHINLKCSALAKSYVGLISFCYLGYEKMSKIKLQRFLQCRMEAIIRSSAHNNYTYIVLWHQSSSVSRNSMSLKRMSSSCWYLWFWTTESRAT